MNSSIRNPQRTKAPAMNWDLAANWCRVWVDVSVSDSGRVGLANRNINTDEGTKQAHIVLYDPAPAIKSAIKSQTGIISKPPTPLGRTSCYTYASFFDLRYLNPISARNL